jgi:hypothetical protein
MRIYARVPADPLSPIDTPKKWVVVTTDARGYNDAVYITAMAQTCKLNLGESPFWANFGIPAKQSVISQIMPDLYVVLIQQFYQKFFSSLLLAKIPSADGVTPQYKLSATSKSGFQFNATIGAQ